jgi:MFS family permease
VDHIRYELSDKVLTGADCIMLIPSQILLIKLRPSMWLSLTEISWGLLTFGIAAVKNYKQIYILRTFLGLLESSVYPGVVTMMSECCAQLLASRPR